MAEVPTDQPLVCASNEIDTAQAISGNSPVVSLCNALGGRGSPQVLLQNGASLDKKDDEGRTPLMLALIHGHEKVSFVSASLETLCVLASSSPSILTPSLRCCCCVLVHRWQSSYCRRASNRGCPVSMIRRISRRRVSTILRTMPTPTPTAGVRFVCLGHCVLLLPGLLGFLTLGPFFLASHVGEQALHFAAEFEGGRHLVELLLSPSLAVDVNVTDRFGRTPVRVITSFVLNVAGRGTNSNPNSCTWRWQRITGRRSPSAS